MAVRLADKANESEGVGTAVLELLTSRQERASGLIL